MSTKCARIGEQRDVVAANRAWAERGKKTSVRATVTTPLVLDPYRGERATVYDTAGNAYLDLGMVGTDNFGYGKTLIARATCIASELAIPLFPEQDVYNTLGILAKERLAKLTPLIGQPVVYAAKSGADANEVTIDALIRARPERRTFGRFERCFHGRNTGVRSLLDNQPEKKKWERVKNYPRPYQTIALPFPSASQNDPIVSLRESLARIDLSWLKQMNGFFMEVVQGEGGINVAHGEALRWLVEELRKFDIAIVVDEVQTGMGRTGTLWAYEQYGISPDVVTMGKSLGGGIADVAAIVMAECWNFKEYGARASTFGFEPSKAAAVLAALDEISRSKLLWRARRIGNVLDERLRSFAKYLPERICDVRGLGAMYALEFRDVHERNRVIDKSLQYGLIVHQCGYPEENPSLRIMPPLVISMRQLQHGLDILGKCLTE